MSRLHVLRRMATVCVVVVGRGRCGRLGRGAREGMLEFAASADPEPVVAGGEGFGFRADPCGGDKHSGGGPFFFHGPGLGADVVGGDASAVALAWIRISAWRTMSVLL